MQTVSLPSEVQQLVLDQRRQGLSVGVVPTMGALHDGHVSLVEAARDQCDFVITTIFVNPTQFGPNEDFDRYPRTFDDDLAKCKAAGADLIFAPEVDTMYPTGSQTTVQVTGLTDVLEGALRPGHFDGVTTVVAKLFHITEPDFAFFGHKDYQQQLVIRQMVRDLNWRLEIVTCPTVRETDGLAMSSRNRYLSALEREVALSLSQWLGETEKAWGNGGRPAGEIEAALQRGLDSTDGLELDYAVIVNADTLAPILEDEEPAVALVAARVGKTRLIDNRILGFRSERQSR